MRVLILLMMLIFATDVLAEGDEPHNVCLSPSDISNTVILDDSTILFRMKGGKTWKNDLDGPCFGLKIQGGFSYEVRGGLICSNQQTIKVLRSMSYCMLGPFTPYVDPPKEGETKP